MKIEIFVIIDAQAKLISRSIDRVPPVMLEAQRRGIPESIDLLSLNARHYLPPSVYVVTPKALAGQCIELHYRISRARAAATIQLPVRISPNLVERAIIN